MQKIPQIIHITSVKALPKHFLYLEFNDGTSKTVDFKPFLSGEVFAPLADQRLFEQVQLNSKFGVPTWQNGQIDIAPETLYYS